MNVEIVVSSSLPPERVADIVIEHINRGLGRRKRPTFMQRIRFRIAMWVHRIARAIDA